MNLPSITSPASRPARQWALVALLASTTWLAGCAAMQSVQSDVSSYGSWTASQSPGSFVIERLPSQQQSTPEQDQLEQAASAALQQAGFRPAAAGSPADFTVQIGARISRTRTLALGRPDVVGRLGHTLEQPGLVPARLGLADALRPIGIPARGGRADP